MKLFLDLLFKLLNIAMEPTLLIVLLLIITLFLLRRGNRRSAVIMIAIALLYIITVGCGFLGKLTTKYLQSAYIDKTEASDTRVPEVIVILGGGITTFEDKEVSNIISFSRLTSAFQLYFRSKKAERPAKILVSGLHNGKNRGASEAALFRDALIKMGVPTADIILEDGSRNTYENVVNTSGMLKKLNASQVYLVTSGFHIKRSLMMFQSFGINCVPYPSDYIDTVISLPNDYNNAMTSLTLHEIVGIWQFILYEWLGLNAH